MSEVDSLQWSDAMRTGVAEMDAQHQILVDSLLGALAKLAGDAAERSLDLLTRDLLAYAIYHFETEEKLMERYGYAQAAADEAAHHKAAHRYFSQRVVALRADALQGVHGAREALLTFLREWLVDHILTTDQRLGRFVCAQRSPGEP